MATQDGCKTRQLLFAEGKPASSPCKAMASRAGNGRSARGTTVQRRKWVKVKTRSRLSPQRQLLGSVVIVCMVASCLFADAAINLGPGRKNSLPAPTKCLMLPCKRNRNRRSRNKCYHISTSEPMAGIRGGDGSAPQAISEGVVAVGPHSDTTDNNSDKKEGGKNIIVQLFGFVKDSVVRFKDGTGQMYADHKSCNAIRKKRKLFLSTIPEEQKATNRRIGLSYDEFATLQKGKEDRAKLGQIVLMLAFSPNIFPYALMFFPQMLPSPFAQGANNMNNRGTAPTNDITSNAQRVAMESAAWVEMSQARAHAIVETVLGLERGSKHAPPMSKLNPFGGAATRRAMERMGRVCDESEKILSTAFANGNQGTSTPAVAHHTKKCTRRRRGFSVRGRQASVTDAVGTSSSTALMVRGSGTDTDGEVAPKSSGEKVLDLLETEIYTSYEPQKDRTRLVIVPKPIARGLGKAIGASSAVTNFLPHFFVRTKLLEHLGRVTEADEFLVHEGIDLEDVNEALLSDACGARLIGNPRSTTEELRTELRNWLDLTVVKPMEKTAAQDGTNVSQDKHEKDGSANLYYNGNLARVALMGYHAVAGVRSERCPSRLPRLLFRTGM